MHTHIQCFFFSFFIESSFCVVFIFLRISLVGGKNNGIPLGKARTFV